MAILGQRFVLLRLQQPDRQAVGLRAMQNARGERQRLRDHLIPMVAGFMQQLPQADPEVSEPQMTTLSKLSNFVTRARSAVQRDGYKRELNYAPEAEMPGRFARQLFSLIRGLAMVAGRSTTSDEDLRRVIRVGLDCLPEVRRLVLKQLAESGRSLTTTELAQQVQYATATMRRALEDCQALELVTCQKGHGGPGAGDRWQLQEAWREPLLDWVQMLSRPPLDFSGTIAPGLPWDAAAEDDAGPPLSEGEASGPSVPVHGHDCLCPECEMSR
jgi:predicted transcriptional regulator